MEKERKKLLLKVLLSVLAALTVLLCGWFVTTYVVLGPSIVPRNSTAVDLQGKELKEPERLAKLAQLETADLRDTGLTEEQFNDLCQLLPDCEIRWSVPFQGEYLDSNIEAVTVTQLTEEDVRMLGYFKSLKTMDALECRDYDHLFALQDSRPELEIEYTLLLGDEEYLWNTEELTLENVDGAQLDEILPRMPKLKRVTLTGKTPEMAVVGAWMAAYPDVTFVWNFDVCGVPASSLDTKLILNDIPMDSVEEVEAALACFYNLEWVEMCNCGISSEEMDALWKRHPETRFVWMVQVGMCNLRTDITWFMPYQFGYDGFSKLWDHQTGELKYCVDLVCLDMGHMGISDYSFLAYMPKMKYLILADTKGSDFSVLAELKELVFLEIFMTEFDQAEVLTGLTKLEDLNIGTSSIDNIEPLLEMTWLKRLWLPGNIKVDHEERTRLKELMPDTIVMFASNGSTGAGWRESPNYYAMRDMLHMGYSAGW